MWIILILLNYSKIFFNFLYFFLFQFLKSKTITILTVHVPTIFTRFVYKQQFQQSLSRFFESQNLCQA